MRRPPHRRPTRRELLGYLARAAVGGVLAAVGWRLLFGRRAPQPGAEPCTDSARCEGCPALSRCTLPPARAARKGSVAS